MTNKIYCFLLATLLVSGITQTLCAQSKAVKEAQIIYNAGIEETTIDPEQSIKTFNNLIEMCGRIGAEADATKAAAQRWLPRAYYNYGVLQFGNGDLLGATKTFETALIACEKYNNSVIADQINRSLYKIYYQLGMTQLEDGRMSAALVSCDKSLSLNPKYAKAYYLKASVYDQKDEPTKMLALMNKAIELAKESGDDMTIKTGNSSIVNYLQRKGARLNERGEHQEAVSWLEKALGYDMSETQTSIVGFELGMGYKALKDNKKACKYLGMATKGHFGDVVIEQMKIMKCR